MMEVKDFDSLKQNLTNWKVVAMQIYFLTPSRAVNSSQINRKRKPFADFSLTLIVCAFGDKNNSSKLICCCVSVWCYREICNIYSLSIEDYANFMWKQFLWFENFVYISVICLKGWNDFWLLMRLILKKIYD